jgi:hypothetical protein
MNFQHIDKPSRPICQSDGSRLLALPIALSTGAALADDDRNGQFHATKDCSAYSGSPTDTA